MKKQFKLLVFRRLTLSLLLCGTLSCTPEGSESELQETDFQNTAQTPFNISARSSCNETSFPSLGPGATRGQVRGCNDAANPNNIGTLDCRSAEGGYANVGAGFGRYRITGSTARFDGTRTRVERFFNSLRHDDDASTTLNYSFIIDNLSSGLTCIVQAHATGEILSANSNNQDRVGQDARSAVFLLYARQTGRRDNNNRELYNLEVHESTTPFTNVSRGNRTRTFFRQITQGVEYNLSYETGYEDGDAFSKIRVYRGNDSRSRTLNHTYTSEAVVTRYGAYEACDVCEDDMVQIRIRNTQLCRSN